MATKNDVAAQIMEHLCTHDWHGYTQGNRWGDGTTETLTIDGQNYTIAGGDRDCSSAVISAYQAAGVPVQDCGATYTGNMRSAFLATGCFDWQPMSYTAQRGDVYLNESNHTAMCTSAVPDMLAQFSISENGTIYGEVGDQTGKESNIRSYYDYPWNGILRYIGEGEATGGAPSSGGGGTSAPSEGIPQLRYRAHVLGGGWMDEMADHTDTGGSGDDFAGEPGENIDGLAIDMCGWYQVKTANSGWLEPVRGYNVDDSENGYAGILGEAITGIRCYYETPNPNATGWLAIEYQAANIGGGFFSAMHDTEDTGGSGDDYAGDGGQIDRFRARLVRV